LPAIAGMLKGECPKDTSFAEVVRKCLYETYPKEFYNINGDNKKGFIEYVQKYNSTLRACAALCATPDGSSLSFKKNSLIHGIINFNLDAVFRSFVLARYGGSPLIVRTIERPSKSSDPLKISVYYMHGFLRFDSKAGNLRKEAHDKLVLSEHEYFDFFNNPNSLFNYTFLHLLREHSCLFIGLSMQDDNIRRLLYYSAKERHHAYIESMFKNFIRQRGLND
jgi:hypothetical protein